MSSIAHTPGPWNLHQKWQGDIIIRAGKTPIAHLHINEKNLVETEANANLIAAAPDMLAALEAHEMAEHSDASRGWELFDHARELRKAAIAKARRIA